MNEKMLMRSSPHVHTKQTTKGIMIDVVIALLPTAVAGCVLFGWKAFFVLCASTISATACEFVWLAVRKKTFAEICKQFDFSSVVTGLLLGLTLPPLDYRYFYIPLLGSVFAVGVVKMLFGGTGKNIVNPAITGRIFCFISFTSVMDGYSLPLFGSLTQNSVMMTGATALKSILEGGNTNLSLLDLFLGTGVAGCIGETCKVAILIGFIYLIVRKVISFSSPLLYVAVCGLTACALEQDITIFLPSVLSGGLLLGAVFMATDYATSPDNKIARIVYYVLLGIVTALLRKGTQMETVSFSILLMNLLVPLFNLYIRPRPFGFKREGKKGAK